MSVMAYKENTMSVMACKESGVSHSGHNRRQRPTSMIQNTKIRV
jgi:hypothetical protein